MPVTGLPANARTTSPSRRPGGRRRTVRLHRHDEHAGRHRELVRARDRARNRHVLPGDADVAAADAAVANQPRRDEPRGVARDREAQALRRQNHRRVDADHLAARRHQRTAGVAGVERRVGLDDVVHQPARPRAQRSAERADDAGGHRVVEAVRVADGDRDLPDAHARANRRASPTAATRRRTPSMRMTARSVSASWPTTIGRASSGRRAATTVSAPARSTTWLLVRMRPSGVKTTPEPPPRSPSILTTAGPTASTASITACEYASSSSASRSRRSGCGGHEFIVGPGPTRASPKRAGGIVRCRGGLQAGRSRQAEAVADFTMASRHPRQAVRARARDDPPRHGPGLQIDDRDVVVAVDRDERARAVRRNQNPFRLLAERRCA